jgi:hypothetical protein
MQDGTLARVFEILGISNGQVEIVEVFDKYFEKVVGRLNFCIVRIRCALALQDI